MRVTAGKTLLIAGIGSALVLPAPLASQSGRVPASRAGTEIVTHDNLERAGSMTGNTLRVRLEVVRGEWRPEGANGPVRDVYAFAEEGRLPHIPGPLLRVPQGSELHVSVRNRLTIPVKMHGLVRRPAARDDFVEVRPGAVHEFRFKVGEAGTYYYWGRTTDSAFAQRNGDDSQLTGALIVDSPATASGSDRIFLIGEWVGPPVPAGTPRKLSLVINGRSWPHTERLTLPFGGAVEWRVINGSVAPHPMHLHGTFYTVESRGTSLRDVTYDAEQRRLVTTELMLPGTTMMMRWVPDRVGNWLFHCHIVAHVTGRMRLGDGPAGYDEHAEHDPQRGMAGLVLGIVVQAGDETAAPDLETHVRRRMTLYVRQSRNGYGTNPAYGFAFVNGTEAPPPIVTGEAFSPPIILARGEPVVIGVANAIDEALSIHWHGIELESFNDGVPGWSGQSRQLMPAVQPGKTFDVNFTPPRTGTFIYHTHAHDNRQLVSGMYGALIVLEPGATFDPVTDHILLLGGAGPGVPPAVAINRSTNPPPLDVKTGVRHRFRIINIMPNNTLTVSLRGASGLVQWRPVYKDGAELPPNQMGPRPATLTIGVGETYDFEYEPSTAGELRLEVSRVGPAGVVGVPTSMLVRVAP